ncbi:Hsp70 family protein [Pseudonocardia kunmingensis]|uniref:Hsp70 protein n=1 Tax=Pseudonocardia kunmingensis TaxID=630975 RepID=A0A543DZS3_9PSEU|nr:Hsp70 family protein [Pseudonocardia kunmingensis]TQM14847.1 Hsp70 protein [Pseudonocardia kunmingensis]
MSYLLGIDLGTTRTAAAIGRLGARPGETEIVNLGDRASAVPSVLYVGDDGSVIVGEAAERRAVSSPGHVVREFKRRIGDPTPIMVAGRPWAPEELSARLVRWVVDRVAQREGGPAARIAVTHPAAWGSHKKERLGGALAAQGLPVTFLAEPQAAALHYASAERVEPGSTIAVYDFGGGTFDAAVVHKDGHSFTLLGRPEGVDRLGGVDFDEIVFQHVLSGMPEAFEGLDETDPAVLSAVAAIRRECVEAKEALSSDTDVSIQVITPLAQGSVRLHRSEFEAAIRPEVEETVEALRRAVASARLAPAQLSAVLLVGGSSRIPLVGQLVSELLGRPVSVDVDPKNAIAMGAALSLAPAPPGTGAWAPQVPAPRASGSGRNPVRAAAAGAAPPFGGAGAPPRPPYGPPAATGAYGHAGASSSLPPHRPAPQRPPAPPPRPAAAAFAPDYDDEPEYDYDYAPERRGRTPGWLVSVGGVGAAIAVIAAVFLWPQPDTQPTASTPAPVAPTRESAEPAAPETSEEPAPTTEQEQPTRPVPPPVTTTRPPVTTTTEPPPVTTTTPPPVSTTEDPPPSGDPTGDPSEPPGPPPGDGDGGGGGNDGGPGSGPGGGSNADGGGTDSGTGTGPGADTAPPV